MGKSKITLEEKINEQKKIVTEMFSSLKEKPKCKTDYLEYFKKCIKKLFKIEMDYYGFECFNNKNSDNEVVIVFEKKENDYAAFFNAGHRNPKNGKLTSRNKIIINTQYNFDELFSNDIFVRMNACRILLKALFHEVAHLRQNYLLNENKTSYLYYLLAKEDVIHLLHPKDFYELNHDTYVSEADANVNAFKEFSELHVLSQYQKYLYAECVADREISYIHSKKFGLIDRDSYIDSSADGIIESYEVLSEFDGYHFLSKEFYDNCTVRPLSNLIENFKNEIKEAKKITNSNTKKETIKDIKGLYYVLFIKRLIEGNIMEFIGAINKHGLKEIEDLINTLKLFILSEEKRKNDLLDKKQEELNNLLKSNIAHYEINKGYIANPRSRYTNSVSTTDFVKTLDLSNVDMYIRDFLKDKAFKERLPINGYYIKRNGKRMSIKAFVEKILIPEFLKKEPIDDIIVYSREWFIRVYKRLLVKHFVSSREMKTIYCRNSIKEDTNEKLSYIERAQEIISDPNVTKYDDHSLYMFNLVVKLCNNDEEAFSILDTPRFKIKGIQYYSFAPEQMNLINELYGVAYNLSNDQLLNPEGIYYYNILINNIKFARIKRNLDKYIEYLANNEDEVNGYSKVLGNGEAE